MPTVVVAARPTVARAARWADEPNALCYMYKWIHAEPELHCCGCLGGSGLKHERTDQEWQSPCVWDALQSRVYCCVCVSGHILLNELQSLRIGELDLEEAANGVYISVIMCVYYTVDPT